MTTDNSRKRKTLSKLGWVCGKIEQILNGQDLRLADIPFPHERKPGETPLERLQRFKAHLGVTLAGIQAGEAVSCRGCAGPIPDAILDDMPWAVSCPACPNA